MGYGYLCPSDPAIKIAVNGTSSVVQGYGVECLLTLLDLLVSNCLQDLAPERVHDPDNVLLSPVPVHDALALLMQCSRCLQACCTDHTQLLHA